MGGRTSGGRKEKTAPDRPQDLRGLIRCGLPLLGLGSGVGLLGFESEPNRDRRGPRPTSPPETAKQLPQPGPSGENYNSAYKKPLCGNRQEKNNGLQDANTGSRKHNVNSAHPSSTCLLLQRDRFKSYFANSPLDLATVEPTVNGYKSF
jgi:hypothetical protein